MKINLEIKNILPIFVTENKTKENMKRNHELYVGERVFDCNEMLVMHVTAINEDGTVELEMLGDDEQENRLMFDSELEEGDYKWTTDEPHMIYQFAKGLVDREGNPVCYEHNDTRDEYPYYAPYLNENLYSFEVFDEHDDFVGTNIKFTMSAELMNLIDDPYDREAVVEGMYPEVAQDIRETADKDFNDSDVRLAMARLLLKTFAKTEEN